LAAAIHESPAAPQFSSQIAKHIEIHLSAAIHESPAAPQFSSQIAKHIEIHLATAIHAPPVDVSLFRRLKNALYHGFC
jgi:hypothetical protein